MIKLVAKDQDDLVKVNARAERGGLAMYKLTFYLGASVSGYIIMKDTYVLPKALGGSGTWDDIFKDAPYAEK